MKILLALVMIAFPMLSFAGQLEPIIDVHMHALAADEQGPPPMGMCTPIEVFSTWDPATPYADVFIEQFKHPPCKDPVWSPMTDEALMDETIAVMNRLNIVGVVSGTSERVAKWRAAAPGRFIPGLEFQIGPRRGSAHCWSLKWPAQGGPVGLPGRLCDVLSCGKGLWISYPSVVPNPFIHGTSVQRVRWFRSGFDSGDVGHCDTFAAMQL